MDGQNAHCRIQFVIDFMSADTCSAFCNCSGVLVAASPTERAAGSSCGADGPGSCKFVKLTVTESVVLLAADFDSAAAFQP